MPDCLDPYFDPGMLEIYHEARNQEREFRARMAPLIEMGAFDKWAAKHDDPEFRAGADENVHRRKMYEALGAFRAKDRPHVLDLQGYASQLIFTSLCLRNFDFDKGPNMDLAYASARAHNRMMVDYCSVDRRLLPAKAVFLTMWACMACIAPFLSVILNSRGLTPTEVGWIAAIRPLASFVGAPIFGALADRWHAHRVRKRRPKPPLTTTPCRFSLIRADFSSAPGRNLRSRS